MLSDPTSNPDVLANESVTGPGVLQYGSGGKFPKLTHYLFRYPAKFHPPVVTSLVTRFSERGDFVLDPFCGSGTTLVESAVAGRNAVGGDIDPLAVFVAKAKTHVYDIPHLKSTSEVLLSRLEQVRRPNAEYEDLKFKDLCVDEAQAIITQERLWVPAIPNLNHWFRSYVLVDLARIWFYIQHMDAPSTHRDFFWLCFAAVIRNSSNADPVPVSGLEVTSHMRRKDAAGRLIDPFTLFSKAVRSRLGAVEEFKRAVGRGVVTRVSQLDATNMASRIRRKFDLILTSPPYHNAVDYYRRHTLETYWLGFAETHQERLRIRQQYIGRSQVSSNHSLVRNGTIAGEQAQRWHAIMGESSPQKAASFKHYIVAMQDSLGQMARLLNPRGKLVLVVGNSSWQGLPLPTSALLEEAAAQWYKKAEEYWYPISNRYMSYQRRNGADIAKEVVLVLNPRG